MAPLGRFCSQYTTPAVKVKGFKPFTAEEVKKLRAKKLAPQQVLEERKKLGLK